EVIRSVYADVMGKLPDAAWAPGATIVRELLPGPPELPETNWRASRQSAARKAERAQNKSGTPGTEQHG
ncbi:hypothetical protein, partial [Kribbella sancticallisti]|uniref:hypothetical protein n=1 Tax=Kribbella sancticallisti TaxID=460087 RepID=UPI0031DF58AB